MDAENAAVLPAPTVEAGSDEDVACAEAPGEERLQQRLMVAEALRRHRSLSSVEVAELLDIEPRAARNLLNALVTDGVAEAQGRARGRRYVARAD